jgi:hypothetical protein
MSSGIKIIDAGGRAFDTTLFSTNTYDSFLITSSTTGSKSYPELAGRTIYSFLQKLNGVAGSSANKIVVSYPAGIPTVTWSLLASGIYGDITERVYVMVS